MRSPEPCPPFEALSAFADGALEASEREQLAAHVGACASCAPLVQSLLDLRRQFVALPDPSPAFDLVPRIEARLAAAASAASARPAQAPRAARPRWWQAALLAPGGAAALA
ncbi:MAG: zf-HC2 domain-containing protein, partial [Pseudomonadota bacterium]